jgi:hypothetical protein
MKGGIPRERLTAWNRWRALMSDAWPAGPLTVYLSNSNGWSPRA